ncbi:MAG: GNAT family N-acetyltransferase [Actinomycetota bacterium]|nr:GNAT family N-acetyltransferase [Actinomycetota bacterium]
MPTEPLRDEVRVRQGASTDLAAVAELYISTRKAAVPAMPAPVHDEESIRRWIAGLGERCELWVAETEEIVGFAALSAVCLEDLYVGPLHQRSGVGSMLLDIAKVQRPAGFGLWVFASNHSAREFYRRHGLVELEHTDGSGNEERSPDVHMAWPGRDPVKFFRTQIDAVDDDLAVVLARRLALSTAVQDYKEPSGGPGRDPERELAIIQRMARHVPGLGAELISRVMDTVIAESLAAWEARRDGVGGS